MSTWNHRVVVETQDGRQWFTIREVHYANRQIVGWTAEEAPGGANLAELKADLAWMRKCLSKPVLIERDGKLVPYRATGARSPRPQPADRVEQGGRVMLTRTEPA